MQLKDNVQAVQINATLKNEKITTQGEAIRSQDAIYDYLKTIES